MPFELKQVEKVFDEAVVLPIDQRAEFLNGACANNPDLRTQVESLLRAHDVAGTFLNPAAPHHARPADETLGSTIGRYKLIKEIGEGGFGIVFLAEQQAPVQRHVALKIIKHGMDSRQVIARFEAERQALAILDHPGIAKVFDGGTTDAGRPYFVMELVEGVSLITYCDQRQLAIPERLHLFLKLCQAVQHAHQKGLIHRDLKPSNILVTSQDDRAVVKVIDFGVARATQPLLTEKTVFTEFRQLIGTPEYMSPEQAEGSLDIDTRSDVYALGVILYELLSGSAPFDPKELRGKAFGEMQRIIREVQPHRPSTRLSKSDGLPSIAANRGLEPKKLRALVHGELDWIVMKSLEKERNRRYETANGFAMDVQRYLDDEAVEACPPSVVYRLRKFAWRHRGPVLAASVVVLALVGGIIGTTLGMFRATAAKAEAVSEAKQKTEALADAREQLFSALVNRARAERSSGRVGQRFEALKVIRAAAQIRITPELRTEAAAALVLPDAELAKEWGRSAEDRSTLVFDASFQRYARLDKHGDLIVCRLSNGREEVITRLPAPGKMPAWGIWMSPDARFVACAFDYTTDMTADGVRVWKVDGSELVVLSPEPPGIHHRALAFHPSGRQLAVGHTDQSVSVYELPSGRRVQRLAVSTKPFHLAFHPREHRLAATCGNVVQLFDTDSGKELPSLRHSAPVTQALYLSWHPDGRRLAVGCNDRKIHLWDTVTATEVMAPWTGHTADGVGGEFNHAGDRLVSSDWAGAPRLWDAVNGRTLLTMPFSGKFSADDSLFGPEYSGDKVRLWRVAGGQELRVLRPRSAGILDNIYHPVVHADGRILAASGRYQLCFFDLVSGEELASAPLPLLNAACPVFFDPPRLPEGKPDGKSGQPEGWAGGWITGGVSGLIHWPARQDSDRPKVMRIGPPRQISPNPKSGFSMGASASADGRIVAVPQGKSTLLLDRDRPERHVVLGPQYDVRFSAVSPDGHWVVTCSWGSDGRSNTIRIWDANTGLPVRDLSQEGFTLAKFSPDGRWLMTVEGGGGGSRQWEVGTWREVRRFEWGKFAFSPDSRLLAISEGFGVIRLLETTTGREVARLTGPEPMWYFPACFTPDGTRLVAAVSDETAVYVWDLRLIRQQLKELGLDWDWPDFPPADPGSTDAKPLQVEVDLGDLAKPAVMPHPSTTQPAAAVPPRP